jgi:hypothetical protein
VHLFKYKIIFVIIHVSAALWTKWEFYIQFNFIKIRSWSIDFLVHYPPPPSSSSSHAYLARLIFIRSLNQIYQGWASVVNNQISTYLAPQFGSDPPPLNYDIMIPTACACVRSNQAWEDMSTHIECLITLSRKMFSFQLRTHIHVNMMLH